MSQTDNISAPTQKRSFLGRLLWCLVAVFVGFHLYAFAVKIIPVPGTILMMQRAMGGEDVKRDWTRIEDISPFLINAVIAAEDARFCSHEGIDWDAVKNAISDNETRQRRRGGSTITQQTAKNVFLWNGGGFIRKVPETWMASFIDYIWGKKRVLEVYLNVAEWGDGIFGAEAAAQARFSKSAKSLTPREAALLASVLPSPNKWRIDPPSEFVNGRARTIQARLYVVRNEGYADCVLGAPDKRIGPAFNPKEATKPISEPELNPNPKPEQAESSKETSGPETDIIEDPLEPVADNPKVAAPESEEDVGIEIKPE